MIPPCFYEHFYSRVIQNTPLETFRKLHSHTMQTAVLMRMGSEETFCPVVLAQPLHAYHHTNKNIA